MSLIFGRNRGVEKRVISPIQAFGTGLDTIINTEPLSLIPLFAAHRVIIDAVSTTPLCRYRLNSDGTRAELTSSSLFNAPDGTQSTFVAACVGSLLYDGNAFGYITGFDYTGWPSSMIWLNPNKVIVEGGLGDLENPTAQPAYYYDRKPIPPERIVHIPWVVVPGKNRGLSPLKAHKVAFDAARSAQRTARDWFDNGAIPAVHVKNTEATIDDQAVVEKLKERYKQAVAGRDVLLTGNDWEVIPIGVPADQAQFIETLKLSATQIASIYGIPPEEIGGETGSNLTYKTLEQQEQRFYGRVITPWATRIEQHLSTLLPRAQTAKFDLDAKVRADLLTRYQAHQIGLQMGLETLDEARLAEDRPPLTPDQLTQWKETYAAQPTPSPTGQPGDQTSDPGGTPNGH